MAYKKFFHSSLDGTIASSCQFIDLCLPEKVGMPRENVKTLSFNTVLEKPH